MDNEAAEDAGVAGLEEDHIGERSGENSDNIAEDVGYEEGQAEMQEISESETEEELCVYASDING